MTRNQLQYQANLEAERANRAKELENYRSNFAKERENYRSNVAKEMETNRSNLASEQLSARSIRTNLASNLTSAAAAAFGGVASALGRVGAVLLGKGGAAHAVKSATKGGATIGEMVEHHKRAQGKF